MRVTNSHGHIKHRATCSSGRLHVNLLPFPDVKGIYLVHRKNVIVCRAPKSKMSYLPPPTHYMRFKMGREDNKNVSYYLEIKTKSSSKYTTKTAFTQKSSFM